MMLRREKERKLHKYINFCQQEFQSALSSVAVWCYQLYIYFFPTNWHFYRVSLEHTFSYCKWFFIDFFLILCHLQYINLQFSSLMFAIHHHHQPSIPISFIRMKRKIKNERNFFARWWQFFSLVLFWTFLNSFKGNHAN